jgi:hypothetical protein
LTSTGAGGTIEHMKEQAFHREGIPPDQQRLIAAGQQLADDHTSAAFRVCVNAPLPVHCLSPRG